MSTLLPVVNATGTVIHTNLGRSPIGEAVLDNIRPLVTGYTSIEYSLENRKRGHRSVHLQQVMNKLTGAEQSAVVNNNAAAVMLILKVLAQGREVLVSRGELVEIGGSFRIPDIMESSGAHMVEVGSTNCTTIEDYERAITKDTALIFKAHHSNFSMSGFTEEVSVADLVALSKRYKVPFYYDLGSGLISRPNLLKDIQEMDVRSAIECGVDIISFSTDKLFGGPQAGIIVGKNSFVTDCERDPLMRVLRVGKMTMASLMVIAKAYLIDDEVKGVSPLHQTLNQSSDDIQSRAKTLKRAIDKKSNGIAYVVSNKGQVGGGTLPDLFIDSYAVKIAPQFKSVKEREAFSESLFEKLHHCDIPIIPVLKEGYIFFDCLTLDDSQVGYIAESLGQILN